MRALITGAGGFVGPYLGRHLAAEGDEVHALDLGNGPDLGDPQGWIDTVGRIRPDTVYHLAGWSDVGGSWQNPAQTFAVNAQGTVAVLEACRRAEVETVVVVSSADVYGQVSADALPLTEDSPTIPRSPYGASKLAAEVAALQYWHGFGLGTIVVRPFNHLGPGQSPRFVASAFAAQIAELELAGGGSLHHGDLSPRRDFTDVRDVVRAYRALAVGARDGERYGRTYNVCSGTEVAMSEVLAGLIGRAAVEVEPQVDPDLLRPVDLPVLRGSCDRLGSETGWEPSISLETTLTDVLDDARERLV